MDMNELLPLSSDALGKQIAQQIFNVLPEQGPITIIVDRDGNHWHSNPEEFSKLNVSNLFLQELCSRIDDGVEPMITLSGDCSIIATQLVTERTNCGHVIIALPQYSPESILINIDLIEIILSQISLIANLVEENIILQELKTKRPDEIPGFIHNAISLN